MKSLSVREVLNAVGGKLFNNDGNDIILNVSTDSRSISNGDLFIPLKGERFDGHKFIESAFEKGAICVLSEKKLDLNKPYIYVRDTKEALAALAEYYRSLFNIPIVAVTGSVGKTTTKDIIYSVLKQKFNTVKTEGNFNNEIGVPATIFKIDESSEAAVIEMGMNHFNEIHRLSKMVRPNAAVITNIGYSHIENLGSREGIFKAKCEIFDFLDKNGVKILNGDDDLLHSISKCENTYFYGVESNEYDFFADEIVEKGINGIGCRIHNDMNSFYANINVPGKHMVLNALAATAVGRCFGVDNHLIERGIESFQLSKMRMDIIKTDKYTIINDVYNANPASMKASIDVLADSNSRKVCILGDMLELGDFAPMLHEEIGEYAFKKGIDVIVCVGHIAKNIYNGAVKNAGDKTENIFYFKNQEDFFDDIKNIINVNDTILVKASRGMKFEKTVEKIMR